MLSSTLRTRMNQVTPFESQLGKELHKTKNVLKLAYDFAVQGGAVGAIPLYDEDGKTVTLPDNAIITGGYLDILTAFTSTGGTGTIAFTANSAGDLLAAVDADTLSGVVAIIPVSTAATAVKLTADRTIAMAIATAAVTAGKCNLFLEYVLSD